MDLDRGGHLILERVMSNKKSSTGTKDEEEKKKARNLYKALTNDSESVFYATNKITKTLVKKARNSLYRKGCLENCPRGKLSLIRVRVWFRISVKIRAGGNFPRGQFS